MHLTRFRYRQKQKSHLLLVLNTRKTCQHIKPVIELKTQPKNSISIHVNLDTRDGRVMPVTRDSDGVSQFLTMKFHISVSLWHAIPFKIMVLHYHWNTKPLLLLYSFISYTILRKHFYNTTILQSVSIWSKRHSSF